jgi:hypothetical protein
MSARRRWVRLAKMPAGGPHLLDHSPVLRFRPWTCRITGSGCDPYSPYLRLSAGTSKLSVSRAARVKQSPGRKHIQSEPDNFCFRREQVARLASEGAAGQRPRRHRPPTAARRARLCRRQKNRRADAPCSAMQQARRRWMTCRLSDSSNEVKGPRGENDHRDSSCALIRLFNQRGPQQPAAHWITSSARFMTASGMVKPSALAVLRLTRSSSFVGCSTGSSLGLAPLSILST